MTLGVHQLRCFVAVAEHGHVTRAANALFMTQPALSAQIRIVETTVGVALFDRHPRGMELTPAGEAFLVHARVCLAEFDSALEAARAAARGADTVIRVGIIVGTQVDVISHVLRTFRSASPGTRVELVEYTFANPSAGLTLDETDVAFVVLPMRTDSLAVLPLARAAIVAAVPIDHPFAEKGALSIAEILDEPWVSTETADEVCRNYWLATAYRSGPPITHHRVKTMDKFVQLVAAGEVIGIAPSWVTQYYEGQAVSFVPVVDVEPPTVALAWRDTDTLRPLVIQMCAAARAVTAAAD